MTEQVLFAPGGATEVTQLQIRDYLDTVELKLQSIRDRLDGGLALDTATLAALETINAIVSGSVSVSNMIPAVETGLATETTLASRASEAKLEAVRALLAATLQVAGTIALDTTTLAALETISVGNFPASQPVTGPLTDTQLRAAVVPVSGPVTDAQLRAASVGVTVANPTANPETGLAKDTNLLSLLAEFRNKYDVVQTATDTYVTSGDHDLIIPAAGQAIRSVWLYAQAKGALDTGTVLVTFTLGPNSYTFELTGSQPFAHGAVWEGAADQKLVVNTSSTAAVIVNADYRSFAP